jgi:hypothetical protein
LKSLTEGSKLLESRWRQVDVVVATSIALVNNSDSDCLAAPGHARSLAACLAVVWVHIYIQACKHGALDSGEIVTKGIDSPTIISWNRLVLIAATHS